MKTPNEREDVMALEMKMVTDVIEKALRALGYGVASHILEITARDDGLMNIGLEFVVRDWRVH